MRLANSIFLVRGRQCENAASGFLKFSSTSVSTDRQYASGAPLTSYKRGTGGRSSFSGLVTTVFGCSGLLGPHVVNKFGKIGSQVICPYRCDPSYVRNLKLMGDIGQILFIPIQLTDEDSIKRALAHSNIVVNCIGRDFETRNFNFDKVHVEGAARIARLAREAGVQRLIHLSALNATKHPEERILSGGSKFYISKAKGEDAVRDEFPDVTIIRPSDIFGPQDRFLQYYRNIRCRAQLRYYWSLQKDYVVYPLWKFGKETVKQPVYVGDVAKTIVEAAQNEYTAGQIIECVGPDRIRLDRLVRYILQMIRYENKKIFIMERFSPRFRIKTKFLELLFPTTHKFGWDRCDREFYTDYLTGELTMEDLGITPERLEDRISYELRPYRRFSYYWESIGEFPEPPPPPYERQNLVI